MRPTSAHVLGAVVALGIGLSSTAMGLEVSIRGESQLRWDVQPLGTMVWVEAQLVDDVGEPLRQRAVNFRLEGADGSVEEVREYTDFFGQVETIIEGGPGAYRLEGKFSGSHHLEGAKRSVELTLEEGQVEVGLSVPRWAIAGQPSVPLQMQVTIDGVGLPGFATVAVDGSEVASVELDRRGGGHLDIGPYLEVGERQVSVEARGGQHSGISKATQRLEVYEELSVEGELEDVFERHRRGVKLGGRISDGSKGVGGVGAILEFDGRGDLLEVEVESNALGEVDALFEQSEFGGGPYQSRIRIPLEGGEELLWEGEVYEVRRTSGDSWLRGLAWLILLAGLLLGGGQTVRALARMDFRRGGRGPNDEDDQDRQGLASSSLEGPVEAEKGGEKGWTLELWDSWRGEAVEGATLRINGEPRAVDKGQLTFRQEDLEWPATIEVEAPGYMRMRREVERGPEVSRWRINVRPIPIEVRQRYRKLVRRIGQPDRWGQWTPREMGEVLLKGEVGEDQRARLERLIAVVEETNFSGQHYDEEVVKEVHRIIEAIVQSEKNAGPGGRDELLR